jgi:hypothetical protein
MISLDVYIRLVEEKVEEKVEEAPYSASVSYVACVPITVNLHAFNPFSTITTFYAACRFTLGRTYRHPYRI